MISRVAEVCRRAACAPGSSGDVASQVATLAFALGALLCNGAVSTAVPGVRRTHGLRCDATASPPTSAGSRSRAPDRVVNRFAHRDGHSLSGDVFVDAREIAKRRCAAIAAARSVGGPAPKVSAAPRSSGALR